MLQAMSVAEEASAAAAGERAATAGSRGGFGLKAVAAGAETLGPLAQREVRERLSKWDVIRGLAVVRLQFDASLEERREGPRGTDAFLAELFSLGEVRAALKLAAGGALRPVYARARCTAVSSDLLERLQAAGLVYRDGELRKCADEQVEDVTVADEVRRALLCQDSRHYSLFGAEERAEVFFQLFRVLAVGGGLCQYEDSVLPYLETTRALYRELVTVARNPGSGRVEVDGAVFAVEALAPAAAGDSKEPVALFSRASPHNACLVFVDREARRATLLRFEFPRGW